MPTNIKPGSLVRIGDMVCVVVYVSFSDVYISAPGAREIHNVGLAFVRACGSPFILREGAYAS